MVKEQYACAEIARRDGLLEVRLHTDGGPFLWGGPSAGSLCELLADIAADPGVHLIILTGTGDIFCGNGMQLDPLPVFTARDWEDIRWHGERLVTSLLGIQAPIIACINGPVTMHAEIPLLCDIVLAADDTHIQDEGHFLVNVVPGDGLHIFMPLLMGLTRARYYLYTGQKIGAREAQDMGLVNELLPREQLLPRARELAAEMLKRSPMVLRYTRLLLMHHVRKLVHDLGGYGGALEGLAVVDLAGRRS